MNQRWLIAAGVIALAVIVGFAAYNAGVQQGVAQSGRIVNAAYPYPYYWHPWGFFFPFLGIALFFLIFRGIFWRGGYRYGYGCGPYPREREDNPDRR
ncbi:MAG TPA: hypothetical protein VKU62_03525 [Thermoanaerobaculia bacterium]|nr:hypothetical protein [Thermoanaerobaculia bacterium]